MKNIRQIKEKLIQRDGLICSVTGEAVASSDELSVEHIVPASKGGSDDLNNLVLVKHQINSVVADNEKKRTRLLVEELKKRQEELTIRERESFEREQAYGLR